MKMIFRSRIYLLLPMMFLLLSTTCEEDDEPPQNIIRPDSLTANFNGQPIDFAYFPDASDIEVGGSTLTGLYISGETENLTRSLSIAIIPFSGPGEYVLDGQTSSEEMDSFNYWTSPPQGGIVTGYGLLDGSTVTVNITQFDGQVVKGTFSGEMKCDDCNGNVQTITITNGVIDVEYESGL